MRPVYCERKGIYLINGCLPSDKRKIMDKFKKVQDLISSVEADATKFYDGGNAAAGTRVRKAMQDLKVLAQEIRAEVTDKKNSAK